MHGGYGKRPGIHQPHDPLLLGKGQRKAQRLCMHLYRRLFQPLWQHKGLPRFPVHGCSGGAPLPQQLPPFKELLDKMWNELQGDYRFKYDLLRNLLMEVIHSAQKMQPATGHANAGSNAAERITGLFAELLERQFPIELSNQVLQLSTPAAFARQLNVHVNHLNKALKETTGQTTSKLINDRILQEAKILLKSTNWTVNEIAWSLGFKEPNHFSSFFKNMTSTTPKQFRLAATID